MSLRHPHHYHPRINFWTGAFGILSIACAFTAIHLAGPVYFLLFIPKTAIPWIMGSKRRRVEEAIVSG